MQFQTWNRPNEYFMQVVRRLGGACLIFRSVDFHIGYETNSTSSYKYVQACKAFVDFEPKIPLSRIFTPALILPDSYACHTDTVGVVHDSDVLLATPSTATGLLCLSVRQIVSYGVYATVKEALLVSQIDDTTFIERLLALPRGGRV